MRAAVLALVLVGSVARAADPPVLLAPDPKVISVGAWMRLAARAQDPNMPGRLDALMLNQVYLMATLRGEVASWLRWHVGLHGGVPTTDATPPYPSIGILDLIVKVEPDPRLNVWFGRMAMAVDRDLLSGPWFINYWTFTGYLGDRPAPPVGLKTGANGRDNGATVWGMFGGGKLKYYLGAFQLDRRTPETSPMFTARLNVDLLDPEPGYYHRSAYHGAKNIIALGGGAQYQRLPTGDVTTVTGDLLLDGTLGRAGVATFQAAAYLLDPHQPVRRFFDLGLGWVAPWPLGPGRIAPAVRFQFTLGPRDYQADGYIQYLVDSHLAKLLLGVIVADVGGVRSNAIQAGVQIIRM